MRSVILADNQEITKYSLRVLIGQLEPGVVIFEAENRNSLLKLLTSEPDSVVVIDYTLFDFSDHYQLANTKDGFRKSSWLLFSEELNEQLIRQLVFSDNSFSIVQKNDSLTEIEVALRRVFQGNHYVSSRVSENIDVKEVAVTASKNTLTQTEKIVLHEIALGKTTKEIAFEKNLSFHTVNTHRRNIFRKLEVNNVHEAIKYAFRAGIIDMAEYYI